MLIKSISGIRGTIGGKSGENLTPEDIVRFVSAYGTWLQNQGFKYKKQKLKVVIGRDARISGEMISMLVSSSLIAMGIDVINIGLSTTPTVQMAVMEEKADGGIIITASHNPKQWNALKFLNSDGELISEEDGEELLKIAEEGKFVFREINALGNVIEVNDYIKKHIDKILKLKLVDKKAIKERKFRIAVDAVNSTGGIAAPMLLEALGVEEVIKIHCEPTGDFIHNPEPLPENLHELAKIVEKKRLDLGFAVDPDVDRLAIVCEGGEMFGEEYTLVAVADYILKNSKNGNTVSNLSSTRALRDVTEKHGGNYFASAVGEVNVVKAMKKHKAVIGGEGNGGVIYPELHYGRDAMVGIALFLTHLAKFGKSCSMLRATYPNYYISKNKIELINGIDPDYLLSGIKEKYRKQPMNTIDGVKIEFGKAWIHIRKSNTEPIIRIYSESESQSTADNLVQKIISDIRELIKTSRNGYS